MQEVNSYFARIIIQRKHDAQSMCVLINTKFHLLLSTEKWIFHRVWRVRWRNSQ